MAYVPHWYFVWGGTLGSGANAEVWQNGLRGQMADGTTDADATDALNGWKTAMQTWFSSAGAQHRNDATMTYMKLNHIGADGRYTSLTTNIINAAATGTVAPSMPDFVCSAISFKTSIRSGPASNGRIYPPNQLVGSSSAGYSRASATSCNNLAQAGRVLITGVKGVWYAPRVFVPAVAGNYGIIDNIVTVRVGDVFDTVRRRKSKLRETYVTA